MLKESNIRKRILLKVNILINRLPERYRWSLHNLIAHPLSEIFYLVGKESISNEIHDMTIPKHQSGAGRG